MPETPAHSHSWSRVRRCLWPIAVWLLPLALSAQVTTRTDAVGQKLNEWYKAKTAAGLAAITYENRDNGHSLLNTAEWPQLQVFRPSQEDIAAKLNIGPAGRVRPTPTFGNCSMAASALQGGSLPRLYFLQPVGFDFLSNQYTHSNLIIYPEHQDYDPGWNGRGGFGDLYIANTPAVLICQGSSFNDMPFLRAFLAAAAALPPDAQATLIRNRMLLPALQGLFRRSSRLVEKEEDYFTAKAHPPVFSGASIDEEKFVQMAHEVTPDKVPPAVVLEVLKEDAVTPGKDFFELEKLQSTLGSNAPFSIARIYRQSATRHSITVSARKSVDILRQPLKLRWLLLQGNPKLVKIEPTADGSEATITVGWHPEMRAPSGIQTHRVEVGVFAASGAVWSAPSFVNFYMLPNEARFHDDQGRLLEICYENGNPDPGLPLPTDLRWLTLGRRLTTEEDSFSIRLLSKGLSEEAIVRLQALANDLAPQQDAWRELSADPANKARADEAMAKLESALSERLRAPTIGGKHTLLEAMETAISMLSNAPDLYITLQEEFGGLARQSPKASAVEDIAIHRKRLMDWGIYKTEESGRISLLNDPELLSPGDRHHIQQFHLTVLSQAALPWFLERSPAPAWVDPNLTTPKSWRDIYLYDKDGQPIGWTRRANGRRYEFDMEGRLHPEGRGRPAVEVRYVKDANGRLVFAPKR